MQGVHFRKAMLLKGKKAGTAEPSSSTTKQARPWERHLIRALMFSAFIVTGVGKLAAFGPLFIVKEQL